MQDTNPKRATACEELKHQSCHKWYLPLVVVPPSEAPALQTFKRIFLRNPCLGQWPEWPQPLTYLVSPSTKTMPILKPQITFKLFKHIKLLANSESERFWTPVTPSLWPQSVPVGPLPSAQRPWSSAPVRFRIRSWEKSARTTDTKAFCCLHAWSRRKCYSYKALACWGGHFCSRIVGFTTFLKGS